MASEWQRKWSRLTSMKWGEARTRISQEVAKRLDSTLYRSSLARPAPLILPYSGMPPSFFFGGREEPRHRAALVREHLPREAEAIVRGADSICRHQFHLLGYENLDYGPNIDWHLDAVHGKRSPLKPWFKIDFLNFHGVGDHKVIWELNRHQHLVTLAKAWLLTNNPVYTKELANQWYGWQKENPYPLGINWASTLEVAFRSLSWLWIRNLLLGCPDIPASFQTDIIVALQLNGRYIERYLSTYFSPNTHLLGEAVALFFIGTLCPEISASGRWRNEGWRIVMGESERQVRPDGVYFEQALYYHVYALDFFLHARHLASKNGFSIPERFDTIQKKMLDVIQALSESGPPEGFGDDDGGRVFNPRRNRVEHMTDPVALGAVLYDRDKYASASLTEESIWLFGDRAIHTFGTPRAPSPISKAFVSGGIYLINDHEPCTQQLMIDAGPQGIGRSGHGHADALSVRLSLDGRRFLVDPGTYCYISGDGERDQFRGTAAHNTLRVDNLDQATPAGPFAWNSIPNVKAEAWLNGQTFDFFTGRHDGYRRLPGSVVHRRTIFHVKGGLWLVRDVAEGGGKHFLESFWHFAPEVEVKEEQGIVRAMSPAGNDSLGHSGLAMLTDRTTGWTAEITEGFVSPAYGSKQAAFILRLSANATLPEDCGVLLLPMDRASNIGTFGAIGESNRRGGVRGYRYQNDQSTEFLFLADGNRKWECGPWASDAVLLYCRLKAGRLMHVIMVSGSFAEWRGRRFVLRATPSPSLEWLKASNVSGSAAEVGVASEFEFTDSEP